MPRNQPARFTRDATEMLSFDDVEILSTNGRMIYVENLITGERDWIAPCDLRRD